MANILCRKCWEEPFFQCKNNPCTYRIQKSIDVFSPSKFPDVPSISSNSTNNNELINLNEFTVDELLDEDEAADTLCTLLNKHNKNINRFAVDNIPLLNYACFQGWRNLVMLLVEKGADPNIRDEKNESTFECASHSGCTHLIDTLFEVGFDFDKLEEGRKQDCLFIASQYSPKLVQYFLHLGFDPNSKVLCNYKDSSYCFTPNAEVLELLLTHGATMESATREKKTIANQIIQTTFLIQLQSFHTVKNMKFESVDRLKVLFKYVGLQQCENYEYTITGRSLLHEAAEHKNTICLEYLLKLGLNPNSRTVVGKRTPLHSAALNKNIQTKSLLVYGADVEAVDNREYTALHYAVKKCNDHEKKIDDVRDLLVYGARPDAPGNMCRTPYQLALDDDSDKCIEWLLLFGAKVKDVNKFANAYFTDTFLSKKMLARHVILGRIAGIIQDLDIDIDMDEHSKKIEDRGKKELDIMKITKITGCEMYYIDLLLAGRRKLAKMAREWPENEFMESEIWRTFPIYRTWLLKNFYLGITYEPVYEKSTASLNIIFDSKLPIIVIEKIMFHLNFADMKNIIKITS